MLGYITDGYTRNGYLEAVPRLYDAVRFAYRPTLPDERSAFLEAGASLKAREANRHTAKFLKLKLLHWNLCDERGDAVPLSVESLLSLTPLLLERIASVVIGHSGGDADPELEAAELDDLTESRGQDRPPGDVSLERQQKNS